MPQNSTAPRILIVGGGYAGFYTAWKLEKHLRKGEADVTMVDPLPYMTYQPFLPEVTAGSIEATDSPEGTVFRVRLPGVPEPEEAHYG